MCVAEQRSEADGRLVGLRGGAWSGGRGLLLAFGYRTSASVKRLLAKRCFQVSAGLVLVLLSSLLSCAWYFRVWSWRDLLAYQGMSQECHPVWRELHWGRIRAGQDVEDVIAATKPVRVDRHGDFVWLNYQGGEGLFDLTGVTVTAKSGRLATAAAWSCTWDRVFFDQLAPADRQAYSDAYEALWQQIREKRDEVKQGASPDRGGM